MAIRRPPTTFSDTISTADIADDAISGDKLANDIGISTTGNIATTGSGTLAVAGASTFTGDVTLPSKYVVCTKIFTLWHSTTSAGISGNTSGTEVLNTGVGNATFANSIYLFSCNVAYNIEDGTNPDRADFGMAAYLQNADGSKKYRFGYYNTGSGTGMWALRHSGMSSAAGNYWLADSDGGNLGQAYIWNQTQFAASDVGGNRTTNVSQNNVASNFSAGEALTLKVLLASHASGINYNSSHTNGQTGSGSKSFYCIKEFTQVN